MDDVVAAPAGTTCDLWPTPEGPCGEPAVVLYVYTHSADERPVNALACDEHAPAYPDDHTDTDLRTDGGHLERPDVEHGKQWYSLRAFQRDCLVAVSVYTDARPPSGREIQAYLERWYHDSVHHSQLYTNLDTLVEAGLLEKTTLDGRTNGYRLTAEGEAVLDRGAVHLQRAANGGENA
ncbi:PadR family transcriptional regulator [Halobellus inordinatus]|uniref:PadR family transcriptional regulator n=1 Tax=Halobellus inordinatus TaxID=1126236 RepID=UPI0021092B3D